MRTAKIILKTFLVVAALGWGQTAWGNESKTVTYTITADGTTLTFTPKGYTFGSGVDPAAKTGSFDEAGFSIELYDGIIFTCKSGTFVQDGNNIYGSGAVTYEITSTGYFFSSEVRDYDGGTVAFTTSRAQSSSSTISEGQRVGQIKLTRASIGAFLAYFQLNNGITAGDLPSSIKSFVHNLDDEILDGIVLPPALHPQSSASAALWFTLDGRRLDTQPTQPGLYIVGGRKVVIK